MQDIKSDSQIVCSLMAAQSDTPPGVSQKRRRNNQQSSEVSYLIENTVLVNVGDNRKVRAGSVITDVENYCGLNSVLAIVPRAADCYEITFPDKDTADLCLDGIVIQGATRESRPVLQNNVMVSILYLPVFLDDDMIYRKFEALGIEIVSPIKRHMMTADDGHKVPDGTRFFRCKFPPNIKSLPYLLKFDTPAGVASYKVLHNDQKKVCHKCWSTDHLLRKCPKIVCNACREYGHIASDCYTEKCYQCREFPYYCECKEFEDYDGENYEAKSEDEQYFENDDEEFMYNFAGIKPTRAQRNSTENTDSEMPESEEEINETVESEIKREKVEPKTSDNNNADDDDGKTNQSEDQIEIDNIDVSQNNETNIIMTHNQPTKKTIVNRGTKTTCRPKDITPVPTTEVNFALREQMRQAKTEVRKKDHEKIISRRRLTRPTPNFEKADRREKAKEKETNTTDTTKEELKHYVDEIIQNSINTQTAQRETTEKSVGEN